MLFLCFLQFRPPATAKSDNSDHLWKVPDPLCGAVFAGRGCESDPRLLSCTFFDPPVHPLIFGSAEIVGWRTLSHTAPTRRFTVLGVSWAAPPLEVASVARTGATVVLVRATAQRFLPFG